MSSAKIQQTKNYRLFTRSQDNRPTDMRKHRPLRDSLLAYGFLRSFPIVVRREGEKLIVKDGQHRLMIAETLGIPVWWVEEVVDFDTAKINQTSRNWTIRDYAVKHAENGLEDYREGLTFADLHKLPIGTAFCLLAGVTTTTSLNPAFHDGDFKVKDRQWADRVAMIYAPIVAMAPETRNARFIEACMAVCRVEGFDPERLITNAKRQRDKLIAYSTRDAYLDMLEEVYNFKRMNLVGLKSAAIMALRERNPGIPGKKDIRCSGKVAVEAKKKKAAAQQANGIDAHA